MRFLRSSDSVFSLSSRNQVSGANEQMQLKSVPSGKFGKTEPENNRKMSQRLRERQQIRFRFVDQFSFQYQFCDIFLKFGKSFRSVSEIGSTVTASLFVLKITFFATQCSLLLLMLTCLLTFSKRIDSGSALRKNQNKILFHVLVWSRLAKM